MRVQKSELLEFIRSREYVTFEDIEEFFTEKRYNFRGGTDLVFRPSKLVAWTGWSQRAGRAILELWGEDKIVFDSVSMSEAPIPPAFRNTKGLSEMNYIPLHIKAR